MGDVGLGQLVANIGQLVNVDLGQLVEVDLGQPVDVGLSQPQGFFQFLGARLHSLQSDWVGQ